MSHNTKKSSSWTVALWQKGAIHLWKNVPKAFNAALITDVENNPNTHQPAPTTLKNIAQRYSIVLKLALVMGAAFFVIGLMIGAIPGGVMTFGAATLPSAVAVGIICGGLMFGAIATAPVWMSAFVACTAAVVTAASMVLTPFTLIADGIRAGIRSLRKHDVKADKSETKGLLGDDGDGDSETNTLQSNSSTPGQHRSPYKSDVLGAQTMRQAANPAEENNGECLNPAFGSALSRSSSATSTGALLAFGDGVIKETDSVLPTHNDSRNLNM